MQTPACEQNMERPAISSICLRIIFAMTFYALILFVPAGSLAYFPAWIFLSTLLFTLLLVLPYMYIYHPETLKRRMKRAEKSKEQRIIVALLALGFYGGIVICALDFRWGWSQVPVYLVLAANIIVGLCFIGVTWVSSVNTFAGATIEVDVKQEVVTTGPYAWVRHPMYSFILVASLAMPIALGSYWAFLLFASVIPVLLHFRMLHEEKMLLRELRAYGEYSRRVTSRVIPLIW